jgi:hypothetical protein
VFSGGLHAPSTATEVRVQDGDVITTDGPYIEGKEHIGGFTVIKAPDLDAALEWDARRRGRSRRCRLTSGGSTMRTDGNGACSCRAHQVRIVDIAFIGPGSRGKYSERRRKNPRRQRVATRYETPS